MTGAIRTGVLFPLLRVLGHQEWLRFGLRDRIIRLFAHPDRVQSHEFECEFFGLRYRGDLNTFIDWSVYFYGAYEKAELACLGDFLRRRADSTVLDIGANVGHHALYFSQRCREVHAFEPYEPVRKRLDEKIALNGITNVVVHDVGLAAKDEELDFFAPTGANTGTGSFVAGHAADNNAYFKKLRVVACDERLKDLSLKDVSLIKIDVEGFEASVLAGLRGTLERFRPIVFMEYTQSTRRHLGSADLASLFPAGYEFLRLSVKGSSYRLTDRALEMPEGHIIAHPRP